MQPRPISETRRPVEPSERVFIDPPSDTWEEMIALAAIAALRP